MIQKKVEIVGVPYRAGQPLPGVEKGPQVLRAAGLLEQVTKWGRVVEDKGSLSPNPGLPDELFTQLVLSRLSARVQTALQEGHFPLVVGGDHTIAAGSIRGALEAHPDLAVVWLDAHGDSNTPETSPTGNWHGMPLAALMGWLGQSPRSSHPLAPGAGFEPLNPRRVAIIGARALDLAERNALERAGVFVRSSQEVRSRGIEQVWKECCRAIDPRGVRPYYLSFDVDSLDPRFAPATGIHESQGLLPEEARRLAKSLSRTGRLVGMDVVELNPDCGSPADLELTISSIFSVLEGALSGRGSRHVRGLPAPLPPLVKRGQRAPRTQREKLIDMMDRGDRDARHRLHAET